MAARWRLYFFLRIYNSSVNCFKTFYIYVFDVRESIDIFRFHIRHEKGCDGHLDFNLFKNHYYVKSNALKFRTGI